MEWKWFSYGGRIQFFNWLLAGKFTYLTQGTSLPNSIIIKVRRLACQFIWDSISNDPSKIRRLRGDRVRDLPIVSREVCVKRISKLWSPNDKNSILISWIQNRHIKNRALEINHLLTHSSERHSCLECRAGYIRWKSGTPLSSVGAIVDTLRDRSHKDTIAKGIWSKMPTKFSIMLWRIKCTFQRLRQWGL